jgi:2-polyprenyl-3-methyl-5-hydroxy-6-metoxy-1,4-benzoquinol methylase
MNINNCRVCGGEFFDKPLLKYENMPKAAQNMPDFTEIKTEKGVDLEVCQCSGCGLVQLNNEPVSYYKEVIRASAFSDEMKAFRLKQFEEIIQKYSLKNKKIIEIGCGKGEYLSLMNKLDVDVCGIEYAQESVDYCKASGLDVAKMYIENENNIITEAPIDAFFILNFFEHLPDPNSTLRALYKNLTDDGIGIVEVPNFNMILQNNLFSEFISDHLFYFTKETLNTTLELNGFEIVECKEIWYDYIISVIVKKRKKLDISHFKNYQDKLKKEIKDYIARFGSGNVAVYGAGHQAMAIISLTNIKDDIKYVIDDAHFKQNKYTPATHIPIVSRDTLITNCVPAIIVMAASYSDEVVSKLQREIYGNINISILRDYGLEEIT